MHARWKCSSQDGCLVDRGGEREKDARQGTAAARWVVQQVTAVAGNDLAAYFKWNQERRSMFILGRSGPDRVPGNLFPVREIYFRGINIPNARSPGYHRVQVWSQSSHLPTRRSDFCAFNLDLDLEPTLHARSPGNHRASLVTIRTYACEKKRFLCQHRSACIVWPLTLTLTLSTPWMHAHLETIVCMFGRNRAICLIVDAICAKSLQTDRQTTDAARLY